VGVCVIQIVDEAVQLDIFHLRHVTFQLLIGVDKSLEVGRDAFDKGLL
jgi:hypothetical protein